MGCNRTFDCNPQLILVGLAGSELIRAGQRLGLTTRQEVFADRGYQPDGTLVPRSRPNALITDESLALAQTLQMVREGTVTTVEGTTASVQADTVCLHGDGEHALQFARRLRAAFAEQGIPRGYPQRGGSPGLLASLYPYDFQALTRIPCSANAARKRRANCSACSPSPCKHTVSA